MSIDMSKMPKIGFGLMRLPENDGVIDIDKVSKMADSYLEAGFTYFDTAYVYHSGNSEKASRKLSLSVIREIHSRSQQSFLRGSYIPWKTGTRYSMSSSKDTA